MREEQTNDPEAAALQALGWTLSDDQRADRFLALTGLTPDQLRGRIGEPGLLAALIRFLEAHEPDLVACATFIGISPLQLIDVRRRLES